MKFAQHLAAHITPEWESQYLRYEELKEILYAAAEKAKGFSEEHKALYYMRVDKRLFSFCERELRKVNAFYSEKISEAQRKLDALVEDMSLYFDHRDSQLSEPISRLNRFRRSNALKQKMKKLKLAFSELYLFLVLIQNYQELNSTGFRKILRKHDKIFRTNQGEIWRKNYIDGAYFDIDKSASLLITKVEDIYIEKLESGQRVAAMKRLRVPRIEEQFSSVVTFLVGFLSGVTMILGITIVLFITYLKYKPIELPWNIVFRLYRWLFLIIFEIGLVGANMYFWTKCGVNHVLIFEIDPRKHLTYQQLIEISLLLFLAFEMSIIAFFICVYYNFRPFIHPFLLLIIILTFTLNPFHFMFYKARIWFIRTLCQIFFPCLQRVEFRHFWLGDQLTSMSLVFADAVYFLAFYIYDYDWKLHTRRKVDLKNLNFIYAYSFASVIPAIFRLLQCIRRYSDSRLIFPHIINAGKYITTLLTITFSTMRIARPCYCKDEESPLTYLFLLSASFETCYKVAWDLKMDWGFFDLNAGDNTFLHDRIVYSTKYFYYIAILTNILIRMSWLSRVYFILRPHTYADDILMFALAAADLFQRFIWNFFRLENEHLNNCGMFRAVRDLSITPLIRTTTGTETDDQIDDDVAENERSTVSKAMTLAVREVIAD